MVDRSLLQLRRTLVIIYYLDRTSEMLPSALHGPALDWIAAQRQRQCCCVLCGSVCGSVCVLRDCQVVST